jgi:hypothetical protein
LWDGATYDMAKGDSTDGMLVNLGANNDVTVTSGAITATGPAADDAAASGNPVPVGGIYNTTLPTYSNLDRTQLQMGSRGSLHAELWQSDGANPLNTSQSNADDLATTTVTLGTKALLYVYDGTNFDRGLAAATGLNSTGAGISTAQIVGQCLGTPGALTDTRFGNIAMNCTDHSLIVSGGLAQEATTSGTLGSGVMGSVTTSAPTYTTAKMDYLSLTTAGSLRVAPDALPANQSVNVAQINGVTPLMGNGTTGTGSPRVTIASDNTTLTNTFGNVGQVPVTSGGTSIFTLTLAASTNATNVKASAGQLYSIDGYNMSSATPIWISTYNNAGTPTCGTAIIEQFMIPGNTTGAGLHANFSVGAAYSTGIAICATTGIAGTGNAAASTYVVNIHYK